MSYNFQQPFMTLGNGLNTMQGGAVGGWKELGRTTLGSAQSTIDVTGFDDKRYYMILSDLDPAASYNKVARTGNSSFDSGSNYAARYSINGAADSSAASQNFLYWGSLKSTPSFQVAYFANLASKEKLSIITSAEQDTAGASNAPTRREVVNKWANTSNVMDRFQVLPFSGTPNMNIGSEVVVLGWDPTDTHTTNFWEELASVTLGSDGDTLSSGTISAKKYLWVQAFMPASGVSDYGVRFNSDSGSNYSRRYSVNGGADGTGTSQTAMWNAVTNTSNTREFFNMFVVNVSAREKLCINHTASIDSAGASVDPHRMELVSKWANTSNQITQVDIFNNGAGDIEAGAIIKVWGSD